MLEIEAFVSNPVTELLDLWIRYQHRPDIRVGWACKSPILQGDSSSDSQQIYDRLDMEVAKAVDTIIEEDMLKILSHAIKYRCRIMRVWPASHPDFPILLEAAEVELEKRLRRNCLTANYF